MQTEDYGTFSSVSTLTGTGRLNSPPAVLASGNASGNDKWRKKVNTERLTNFLYLP